MSISWLIMSHIAPPAVTQLPSDSTSYSDHTVIQESSASLIIVTFHLGSYSCVIDAVGLSRGRLRGTMAHLVASVINFVHFVHLAAELNKDVVKVFLVVVALRSVMIVILLSKVEE